MNGLVTDQTSGHSLRRKQGLVPHLLCRRPGQQVRENRALRSLVDRRQHDYAFAINPSPRPPEVPAYPGERLTAPPPYCINRKELDATEELGETQTLK